MMSLLHSFVDMGLSNAVLPLSTMEIAVLQSMNADEHAPIG